MFKRAKVILIPTEKSNMCKRIDQENNFSDILIQSNKDAFKNDISFGFHIQPFELYIVSDDEIKEGDWVKLHVKHVDKEWIHRVSKQDLIEYPSFNNEGKKIIATTDTLPTESYQGHFESKDCTNYLPQPSQAFIEKYIEQYNKGNQITDVLVEYDCDRNEMPAKVIDILKVNSKDNTITIKKVKDSWSKKEVTDLIIKLIADSHFTDDREALIYIEDYGDDGFSDYHLGNGFEKWIEENL